MRPYSGTAIFWSMAIVVLSILPVVEASASGGDFLRLRVSTGIGHGANPLPNYGFLSNFAAVLEEGKNGYGMAIAPTFNEANRGTHDLISSLYVNPPIIRGSTAKVVDAASLVVEGPPTAEGATNLALFVKTGNSRIRDQLYVGPATDGAPTHTQTPLHVYSNSPGAVEVLRLETNNGDKARPYLGLRANGTDMGYLGYGSAGGRGLTLANYVAGPIAFFTNSLRRVTIDPHLDGMSFGADQDTNLYRADAATLATDGNLRVGGALVLSKSTAPACDVDSRGQIRLEYGPPGVADEVVICMKAADDSYHWRRLPGT